MCGIAGLMGPSAADRSLLERMGAALHHRGPDDGGVWHDRAAGIGFAHRRLAIVDLSPAGRQPMASSDGRFMLSFNGEVYNHHDIRKEVEREGMAPGTGWRGHSDTETIVETVRAFGLDRTLTLLVGMFAFALWDRQERTLHLARDRFGEKPLYVGAIGRDLAFASELKALRQLPAFSGEIEPDAMDAYVSLQQAPAPLSIYRRIYKLMPGTVMTVRAGFNASDLPDRPLPGIASGGLTYARFWDYQAVVEEGDNRPYQSRHEATAAVDQALAAAIDGQSVADVPIGAFLSGGIDSSTIAAVYQSRSTRPISTFTIGFDQKEYDESVHAAAIARHLRTNHHELIVTATETRNVIPLLPEIYDEPFADSSQIPTYIVSKFARGSVTVAMSGDGGDELFSGYNRHVLGSRFWSKVGSVPVGVRAALSTMLGTVPNGVWASLGRGEHFPAKIRKGLAVAGRSSSLDDVYASFLDEWYERSSPLTSGAHWRAALPPIDKGLAASSRLAYWDAVGYLPDDILVKVDRAAMAVSLETRVPFLDHRLAAAAARVPCRWKVDGRGGKAILRDVLQQYVPENLFQRPKTGFGIPIGDWLRGPLRDWAESLIDERSLGDHDLFNAAIVRGRWREHLAGAKDATPALWAILMFQAWYQRQ